MNSLRRQWHRLRGALRRTPSDGDLARELRFHLEQAEAELRGRGYSRRDARRLARARSGGFFAALEALRAERGLGRTMDLWDDVRYGARRLANDRWFTVAAVTALALGIGANTTVFTLVNAMLIRGLPFDDPDRIVAVWTGNPEGQRLRVSYPDYEDWREQSATLAGLAAYGNWTINFGDGQQVPERAMGAYVSADFFRVLGEQPALGRDFGPDDDRDGAEPVVLLGHNLWENRYARDPGVLGQTVRVNGLVANRRRRHGSRNAFPQQHGHMDRAGRPSAGVECPGPGTRTYQAIGRLTPEASMAQAREELQAIGRRLAEAYPASNRELAPDLLGFQDRYTAGATRLVLLTLTGAVAFVLLIACTNVAGLLLARSAGRRHEVAVRVAMGATRLRIVRQLLVESLLLAVVAGAGGLLFSVAGIRWFDGATRGAAIGRPYWMDFTLDGTIFAFIAALCLGTAVTVGLVPALQLSGTPVAGVLKEDALGNTGGIRTPRWAGGALVVGQLTLSLVLLSGAGFMLRSFLSLYGMDAAFETSRIMTTWLYLPPAQYPEASARADLYQNFGDRLASIPALRGHAIATAPPMAGGATRPVATGGRVAQDGEALPLTTVVSVSDGHFEALGIELTGGRTFRREDGREGSEVAIVNERFVEMYLEGEPLGQHIRLPVEGSEAEAPRLTVIGISPHDSARAARGARARTGGLPSVALGSPNFVIVMVQAPSDAASVIPQVQDAIGAIDPDLPLFNTMTMDQLMALGRWPYRVLGLMLSLFAGIALILSAVGVYAVTASSVAQRTREIGIRVALGAEAGQISWLALRRSLRYLAIGLPAGLLGALGVGQVLAAILVVSPTDPLTIAGIVALFAVVGLVACVVPARRAAHLDPMVALRVE